MTGAAISPKFRIAICGAGPGGLALAATLAHFTSPSSPVLVDLYETAPEIGTVGAGIGVYTRTRNMLESIGLADEFRKGMNAVTGHEEAYVPPEEPHTLPVTFRKSDQEASGSDFYVLNVPRAYMIHRSVLVNVIKNAVQSNQFCSIHTSSHFVSYDIVESASARQFLLHFSNGSTATADVLIGADGVHSAVRRDIYAHVPATEVNWTEEDTTSQWSGTIAYRSLIQGEALEKAWPDHDSRKRPNIFCGQGKHIVTYPINGGSLINIVAFYTVPGGKGTVFDGKSVRDASVDELMECYVGWEPKVQAILKCVDKVSAWAIDIVPNIPHCAIGNSAIIGDAAHAMETHFGAGAGQAMEDAYILGRILTHPSVTLSNVPKALQIYERLRLDLGRQLVKDCRTVGDFYQFLDGPKPEGVTGIDDWASHWGEQVSNYFAWQAEKGGVDKDWNEAEDILNAEL